MTTIELVGVKIINGKKFPVFELVNPERRMMAAHANANGWSKKRIRREIKKEKRNG